MAARLNPYISFAGDARQAMEFCAGVFGGEPELHTFGEYGAPGEGGDKIMHASLETPNGFTLMCSDTPPGMDHDPGNNITVSLSGDDADQLRGYWEKLADGGAIAMPLEMQVLGRRVRHLQRQVRHPVDGQHRRAPGLTGVTRGDPSPGPARAGGWPSRVRL